MHHGDSTHLRRVVSFIRPCTVTFPGPLDVMMGFSTDWHARPGSDSEFARLVTVVAFNTA